MKNIAIRKNTQAILDQYDLNALKKYGQNFLVDANIIHKIAQQANITKETCVIEIGPGIGALTEELAHQAKHVIAFEIDERMKNVLDHELECHNVEVILQDFMKVNLEEVVSTIEEEDVCVVTNLPYYITTDIIKKVLTTPTRINRMVALIQKEVALKLTGEEKSPLSNMIDYVGDIKYCMTVGKSVFIPAPHVDSAVIRIHKERNMDPVLIEVLEAAFKQKRKTMNNNMKALFQNETAQVLAACNINLTKRAQELSIHDFMKLAEERRKRL